MLYEPKTLIIVYKDEMVANQMKKLIETKDDSNGIVIGTTDDSINVVTWTEQVWLANKKAGNIKSKVLFLGDIKGVDMLIPVLDMKFDKHGIRYGWAGNQAVLYVSPNKIKSINAYRDFYEELVSLPVPHVVKNAIKPKIVPAKESEDKEKKNKPKNKNEDNGFFAMGMQFVKMVGDSIGDVVGDVGAKALEFSEEIFKDMRAIERQMLFFGVIKMYNDSLEIFMKS